MLLGILKFSPSWILHQCENLQAAASGKLIGSHRMADFSQKPTENSNSSSHLKRFIYNTNTTTPYDSFSMNDSYFKIDFLFKVDVVML